MEQKKLIFDFDGTLVDSMREWAGKMLNVLHTYHIDYPADIIKTVTPLGDRGTAEYFIQAFAIDATVNELIAMMDEYAMDKYAKYISAKDTVQETLVTLKRCGYSLNVLTASPHKMLDACLKRVDLYDCFDHIWSCEDFDTTKGDIAIYRSVAGALGTTCENCIFLDDNIHALTVAKRAGMTVIGVYDESSDDLMQEIKDISHFYICTMRDLLSIVPIDIAEKYSM